jgi:hypothetical protein
MSIFVGSLTASPRLVFAEDEATLQARQHYQEAQKQFDLGMWDAAIVEFTKAYELRPDPNFLYNMAQAYRRGGNPRRAIDLYKNYLIKVPKSPQRAEVAERIQTLQKQLDDEEREAKRTAPQPLAPTSTPESAKSPGESVVPPPAVAPAGEAPVLSSANAQPGAGVSAEQVPPTTATSAIAKDGPPPTSDAAVTASPEDASVMALPAQPSGSRPLRIAGIVAGAAGLAGIGGGVFFSARTKSLSNSTTNAAQFNSADARAGKQAATLQWVCYGAGGAAAVAGILFYWRGHARTAQPTAVSIVPMLAPTHAGLLATGSF